ncbi:MAG TPA: hypothetical protein DDW52_11850 [Planctomycetaceae bacterium]|nr:hypothetical protein [Planctomycetaceae bacterium]
MTSNDELPIGLRESVNAVVSEKVPDIDRAAMLSRVERQLAQPSRFQVRRSHALAATVLLATTSLAALFALRSTPSLAFDEAVEKLSSPMMLSYTSTYIYPERVHKQKVFHAVDGRRRIENEAVNSRGPLICIRDDFGLDRIRLRPKSKVAYVIPAIEEFEGDSSKLSSWIDRLKKLTEQAKEVPERRTIGGIEVFGFTVSQGADQAIVWIDATNNVREVQVMSAGFTKILSDFRSYEKLNEELFSFEPPSGYSVVHQER